MILTTISRKIFYDNQIVVGETVLLTTVIVLCVSTTTIVCDDILCVLF